MEQMLSHGFRRKILYSVPIMPIGKFIDGIRKHFYCFVQLMANWKVIRIFAHTLLIVFYVDRAYALGYGT